MTALSAATNGMIRVRADGRELDADDDFDEDDEDGFEAGYTINYLSDSGRSGDVVGISHIDTKG
ncbi:MAG TPA: hypothetical protein DCM67_09300 [Propionibacteriaceae bacterium]|nr:hypothetical protein [Propionibacteriaceae bacterium]